MSAAVSAAVKLLWFSYSRAEWYKTSGAKLRLMGNKTCLNISLWRSCGERLHVGAFEMARRPTPPWSCFSGQIQQENASLNTLSDTHCKSFAALVDMLNYSLDFTRKTSIKASTAEQTFSNFKHSIITLQLVKNEKWSFSYKAFCFTFCIFLCRGHATL